MNGYLVDTNVLSEYAKPVPSQQVLLWFERADPDTLYTNVITFGELFLGVENLTAGKRRSDLEIWLQTGLPKWFGSRALPVTYEIAVRWGQMVVQSKRFGIALHVPDGLIAATAVEHGLSLVTRNVKDFAHLDLELFNPWTRAV